MGDFASSHLKIKRANKHIADLETAVLKLKESYISTIEVNSDTGYQELIHACPEFAEAVDDMALIAGDAIHNLRAALDFAWISTLEIHVPAANRDRAKFPVYPTRQELEGALNGIEINRTSHSGVFKCIVADIQPYLGGKFGVISILHNLDICDKHLVLLDLHPIAGINGIVVQDQNGVIIRGFGGAIHDPPPYVIPFQKNVHIKDKGKLTFDIVLKEAGVYNSIHITEALHKFSNVVFFVVELMENIATLSHASARTQRA